MNHITQFTEPIPADARRDDAGGFRRSMGFRCAGVHLLLDFWDAAHLDDRPALEAAFRSAVDEAGATLLRLDFHTFTPNGGVSGVALLAESHISIHTWPEHGFAAADVFMCGAARPHTAAHVLARALRPARMTLGEHRRGVSP